MFSTNRFDTMDKLYFLRVRFTKKYARQYILYAIGLSYNYLVFGWLGRSNMFQHLNADMAAVFIVLGMVTILTEATSEVLLYDEVVIMLLHTTTNVGNNVHC